MKITQILTLSFMLVVYLVSGQEKEEFVFYYNVNSKTDKSKITALRITDISQLPEDLKQFTNLKKLDIRFNPALEYISNDIKYLSQLEELNAAFCNLKKLPNSL